MRRYTKVNLKKVENLAPKFGFSPDMEAWFARVALGLENSGISYFRFAPNFRQAFGHRHERQEEIYVIVAGSARAKIGEDLVELQAWDTARVPPEVSRACEAGPEGFEMVVFGAPNTGNQNAEALPGWWTG